MAHWLGNLVCFLVVALFVWMFSSRKTEEEREKEAEEKRKLDDTAWMDEKKGVETENSQREKKKKKKKKKDNTPSQESDFKRKQTFVSSGKNSKFTTVAGEMNAQLDYTVEDSNSDDGEVMSKTQLKKSIKHNSEELKKSGFKITTLGKSVKPKPDVQKLPEGLKVEARYQGGDDYYKGTITKVHREGNYTIKYDDGEVETKVQRSFIKTDEDRDAEYDRLDDMDENFWGSDDDAGGWTELKKPQTPGQRRALPGGASKTGDSQQQQQLTKKQRETRRKREKQREMKELLREQQQEKTLHRRWQQK